jgi:tetratricopeptide (TPR) repeat protein
MAARVNKQFVITLALALAGVFVVVAAGAFLLLKNSAKDLSHAGDQKMEAKQYDKAQEYYAKAVNKEQTNTIYLEKWRASLAKLNPETQHSYRDNFEQWRKATRQLARVQKDNVDAQREYLELLKGMLPFEFSRADQENMITEASSLISLHTGKGTWDTLKRYRGRAKFEIVNFVKDSKTDLSKEAEADLKDALEADPTDTETALTLESLYYVLAQRAAEKSLQDDAEALVAKATKVVQDQLKNNPNDPLIRLESIGRAIAARQRQLAKTRTPDMDVGAELKKLQTELKPEYDAAVASVQSIDPSLISLRMLESLRIIESYLNGQNQLTATQAAVERALSKKPGDPMLLTTKADLLASREDLAGASEALEQILNLPLPSTSLEGIRLFGLRANSRFLRALWAGRIAAGLTAPEKAADRTKALATAKDLREKLAAVEAPDSPLVQFVDAQIAFVEDDNGKANRLLENYEKTMRNRTSADALLLHAQVADRLNQLGLAEQKLEECTRIAPSNMRGQVYYADVLTRLQKFDQAIKIYEVVLPALADNQYIKQRLEVLRGLKSGSKISDPVVQVLVDVRDMQSNKPGAKDRSAEVIPFLKRKVEEHKYDPRLVQQLAALLMAQNKRDEASALAKKALAANPDSEELKEIDITLANPDPMAANLALIDSRKAPEIDKALTKYNVYLQAGKRDLASAELAKAAAINAGDKRVVSLQFHDALDAKNYELAEKLLKVAKDANLDDADGLTYVALLETSKGNLSKGLTAVSEAVAKGGAQPEIWRLKGRMELSAGRTTDAIESFRQALKLRPSDVGAITDTLATLARAGKPEDALVLARESEKYARGDKGFTAMWLDLESDVGSKAFAIERREAMAQTAPDDRQNLVALASLYIAEREWTKARPIIDRARTITDGTDVLVLDASWNWEQGDTQKARNLFSEFIGKVDKSKLTSYPYLLYGQFLMQHSDSKGALAVLDEGRAQQDPKIAEVDKAIVELHMKGSEFELAASVCRRILTANADTEEALFRKRMIECLVKLRNFADADKELAQLPSGTDADAVTMLLAADVKAGMKDFKGQKDILDRAVAKFPSDAMVFLKRGQSMLGDSKTARDAISDFNKALQLNPTLWQALRMRGAANITLNNVEEAIKDLRAAVKLSPYNDELLYGLLSDLMRMGKTADAVDISTEVLTKRTRDVEAMSTVGTIFATAGAHAEAARFFRMAFDIDQRDLIAQRYLDSLLAATPPNTAEAQQILKTLGDQRVRTNPGFLMAAAKLSLKLSRRPGDNNALAANAFARDALRLLKNDEPSMMLAWFNDLRKLLIKKEDLARYIDDTAKLAAHTASIEWLTYFGVAINLDDPATASGVLGSARELLDKAKEPSIRQLLFRSISSAIYASGDYNEAIKLMREGLGQFPNDVELLNNAAYCLAIKLGKPKEAVSMTEKAVELAPAVADVQDTFGAVFAANKDFLKAADGYQRALLLASTPQQMLNYSTHVIEALAQAGRIDDAKLRTREADRTIEANKDSLTPESVKKYEEVKKFVNTPK